MEIRGSEELRTKDDNDEFRAKDYRAKFRETEIIELHEKSSFHRRKN